MARGGGLSFRQMQETDFEAVIELGNKVHVEKI